MTRISLIMTTGMIERNLKVENQLASTVYKVVTLCGDILLHKITCTSASTTKIVEIERYIKS